MAYTGKRPGNVNTDFLEAGGELENHDELVVDSNGEITQASITNLVATLANKLNVDGDGSQLTGITTIDYTLSTADPATDTNPTAVGHLWINKNTGECYICTDNTTDENSWINIGAGAGDVIPVSFYGNRGIIAGGEVHSEIDYITISTTGNASDFGSLSYNVYGLGACTNGSRAVFAGGHDGSNYREDLQYITVSTPGNASSFGVLSVADLWTYNEGASNGTRGVFAGGWNPNQDHIDYITIATTGNGTDFGNLTVAKHAHGAVSNDTRGVFSGGYLATSTIDYVNIATTGNALAFGNMYTARLGTSGVENDTRGVFGGGDGTIDYITIATTGNALSFGNLPSGMNHYRGGGCSNGTRGVFVGGGQSIGNVMSYITIASTGNGSDFGDLTSSSWENTTGTSGD